MISATTEKYAAARNLSILVDSEEDDKVLYIYEADNDDEWLCSYVGGTHGYAFHGSVYLPESIKEELPAFIRDEKHLREVIDFVSKELKKIKEESCIANFAEEINQRYK